MAKQFKNYNIDALKGVEVDDLTIRDELKEVNDIDIPVKFCHTPEFPRKVIAAFRHQNIQQLQQVVNPNTGVKYTAKEAMKEADLGAREANRSVDALMMAAKKKQQ